VFPLWLCYRFAFLTSLLVHLTSTKASSTEEDQGALAVVVTGRGYYPAQRDGSGSLYYGNQKEQGYAVIYRGVQGAWIIGKGSPNYPRYDGHNVAKYRNQEPSVEVPRHGWMDVWDGTMSGIFPEHPSQQQLPLPGGEEVGNG